MKKLFIAAFAILLLNSVLQSSITLAPPGFENIKEIRSSKPTRSQIFQFYKGHSYINFYAPWHTKGKLILLKTEKNPLIYRLIPKGAENQPYLEIKKSENDIVFTYFEPDGTQASECQETGFYLNPNKNTHNLGTIENFEAGKRIINYVSGIPVADYTESEVFEFLLRLKEFRKTLEFEVPESGEIEINKQIRLYFPKNIFCSLNKIIFLCDRPSEPRFFAVVDASNYENRIVFELIGDKLFILSNARGKNNIAYHFKHTLKHAKKIGFQRLCAAEEFLRKLSRNELILKEMNKGRNNTAFTRKIAINISKKDFGMCWLTPSLSSLYNNEMPRYLMKKEQEDIIRNSISIPDTLESLNENSDFISYSKNSGLNNPEWLAVKRNGSYEYFLKLGSKNYGSDEHVVYYKINKNHRIATLRFIENKKYFYFDELKVDGKPLLFKEGNLHLSAFIYVLFKYSDSISSRIEISPAMKSLECENDLQLGLLNHSKTPISISPVKTNGNYYWVADKYTLVSWSSPRTKEEQKIISSAQEKSSLIGPGLVKGIADCGKHIKEAM